MRITIESPLETEENRDELRGIQDLIRELIDERIYHIGLSKWEAGVLHIDVEPDDPGWKRIIPTIQITRSLEFRILMNNNVDKSKTLS